VLFLAAIFLYSVTNCVYAPTLPIYIEGKTVHLALVGLTLSMYGLWQMVVRLPLGIVADRIGWAKPYIIGGFALAALGTWTMGRASDITELMVGRSFTGVAAGIFGPLVVAFNGLYLQHETVRASTILITVASAGTLVSTSVTGVLNRLGGYPLAFYVASGAALLAAALLLPARERRHAPQPISMQGLRCLVAEGEVLLPTLLGTAIQYAATATTFGFLPILAARLGVDDVMIGVLTGSQVASVTLGSVLARRVSQRLSPLWLLPASLLLLSAGVGVAALASSLGLLFLCECLIGLGWGTCYPVITGMSIQKIEDFGRNSAMGVFQLGCSVGVFAGSWVSGLVAGWTGIRSMFGLTALGLALVALALLYKSVHGNPMYTERGGRTYV
jgi:MFS family permease